MNETVEPNTRDWNMRTHGYYHYKCPQCSTSVEQRRYRFCRTCGLKLDWSKVDEKEKAEKLL